jgi:hypothetical protein
MRKQTRKNKRQPVSSITCAEQSITPCLHLSLLFLAYSRIDQALVSMLMSDDYMSNASGPGNGSKSMYKSKQSKNDPTI